MQSLSQQFAAWVRTKPADEEYNYMSNSNCALCQGLRALGYPVSEVDGLDWFDAENNPHPIPEPLGTLLVTAPRTFGALAERLSNEAA